MGGDGGLVETSGADNLGVAATASVDARATNGTAGSWLLDPADLEVVAAEGTADIVDGTNAPVTATTIDAGVIVTALNGNNVTLLADNSITVNAAIDASENEGLGFLTLIAPTVNLNENITLFPILGSGLLDGTATIVNVGAAGSILDALEVAIAGATINLAAATYQEGEAINIRQDVSIQGAGAGSTLIDGNNQHRVLFVDDPSVVEIGNLTILNGIDAAGGGGIDNRGTLTIQSSVIRNNQSTASGGGIYNEGTLTLNSSSVTNNQASGGGGIHSLNGTLTISNSSIEQNTATGANAPGVGGGILLRLGTASITNTTIARNSASLNGGGIGTIGPTNASITIANSTIQGNSAGSGSGGGIELVDASLDITNSTISGNTAAQSGGGIRNVGALTIANSVISQNIAETFWGGGIANISSTELRIDGSIISDNEAPFGGGIDHSGSLLTIRNSTLAGNQATGEFGGGAIGSSGLLTIDQNTFNNNTANQGGALFITSNTLNLNRSTLSGNLASAQGGAIFNSAGTVNVNNSTIAFNFASGAGGGLAGESDSSLGNALSLESSLITGNTASNGANISGFYTSRGNNLIGANGQAGADPFLLGATDIVPTVPLNQILNSALVNNGGLTQTHALVAGSPAIDQGSGTAADQRDINVVNGIRDIGAFEFAPGPSTGPPTSPPTSPPDSGDSLGSGTPAERFLVDQEDESLTTVVDSWGEADQSNDTTVAAFRDHLAVDPTAFEDFDVLDRALTLTRVPPALVYARFVSDANEFAIAQAIDPDKALERRARELIAQAETRPNPGIGSANDVLELVLVMPDGEPRRFSTGVTRSEVMQAVQQLQIELTDRTRRRLDNYLHPAQRLYEWLVAPVEETLAEESIGHISFVLDQGLRSIPLAALHDGKQFIIERYSVGLMPSLTLTDTRIGNVRNASVLAMGASEFADQPPLPAVPVELSAIETTWPGSLYLNEAFTPETLVQARQGSPYRILHLATHGQFSSGALSNSYIQFWDRRLTLDELPQLGLSEPTVELLVLSACRTVLGSEEAELGFAGVAVKSGAKSAIAALWQVSDLETAGLMAELYTQLGQASYKAEALRQAQLAMLRGEITVQDGYLTWSGGQIPLPETFSDLTWADTRHPYYWSAFTLVGSPW
jgi:CHAT domain-containing protein